MNEIEFKNWLSKNNVKKKVQSDLISRVKRIEKEINHDIDEQYHIDKCDYLMSLFLNMGKNDNMKKYPGASFPIGKYSMNAFRYAIKLYVKFCDDLNV